MSVTDSYFHTVLSVTDRMLFHIRTCYVLIASVEVLYARAGVVLPKVDLCKVSLDTMPFFIGIYAPFIFCPAPLPLTY